LDLYVIGKFCAAEATTKPSWGSTFSSQKSHVSMLLLLSTKHFFYI